MFNFNLKPSIQNKVKCGYYICLSLIIVVALLNYFNLKRLERKIAFSFVISDLFDTALEIRRFEKNYFLHNLPDDYHENLRYINAAEDIIRNNRRAIGNLSISTDVNHLEIAISEYKVLMEEYFLMHQTGRMDDSPKMEGQIWTKGKKIANIAETISTAEKRYIQWLILSSKRFLLASILVLLISGWLLGRYLSRMVVEPLKQLEESMQRMADGIFDTCEAIPVDSTDREIVSLGNACNRMIKELELKQMKVIIQSAKLISLGTMASGIAHQLNNPLSNISTSCQILHEEIEEHDLEYKKQLLEQIEGQVDRAKTMVHSLLEFSRKKELKRTTVPVTGLVAETIRLLQGSIPTHVQMRLNIPDGISIVADKQRIQQVLLNVIKNGIDAMPEKGIILITAGREAEDRLVTITVRDSGTGMEPETLRNIFDPFFTTKDEGKGSGLGLFVAREIVEEHGGAIDVYSAPGEGSTFSIKLPAKEL